MRALYDLLFKDINSEDREALENRLLSLAQGNESTCMTALNESYGLSVFVERGDVNTTTTVRREDPKAAVTNL
jgi:hypothetical protein